MTLIMTQLLDTSSLHPVSHELGRLFDSAGYELSLVGGPVRDAVLGRSSADLDFTTSARPEQTEAIPAHRGTIYDANDTVLAQSQERRTVVVDQTAVPAYEKDVDGTQTKVGTAGAAKDLAERGARDEAAIASRRAAEH